MLAIQAGGCFLGKKAGNKYYGCQECMNCFLSTDVRAQVRHYHCHIASTNIFANVIEIWTTDSMINDEKRSISMKLLDQIHLG